ncbi:telomerase reverse transcriptase [Ceratobasidium sp. AG-Ba]|nr:telomerase reverse transcriptase [Ceratobasidium sp. AG-Ba]
MTNRGNVRLGLPAKHLLNRVVQDLPESDESRKHMEAAVRHVSKHIFPLQYSLHNVFTCTLSYWENGGHFRDYGDREAEIEGQGSQKTPGRLKKVLPLIESLIRRHKRFNYQRVCASICRSRLDSSSSSSLDQTKILVSVCLAYSERLLSLMQELMSEYSQSIIANFTMSQIPDKSYQVSHPSLVLPHGASEAALETKLKPRFVEFACSHHEVLRYIKVVVDEVIPHAFWGSVANRKLIDAHIQKIVTQRRFETLTLHALMQNLSVADCDWLGDTKDRRVCQSDALKRAELFREFIYWFFDSFLMPLVRASFYVTETSALQHQLLYFRHDDWHTLCIPLLDKLSGETFERIDLSELEPSRRLGISHVRLLPKETGVRPIVNLGRKAKVKQTKIPGARQPSSSKDESSRPSVNQVLNAAFNILNYEKTQNPELLGASVFGSNDIYRKLSAFKASVLKPDGSMPKLYFVKLDVRACFDTIDQDKLLGILRDCMTQDGYMIRKFTQLQFSTGQTRRSFRKKAVPDFEHTHFMNYASRLAAQLRHVIFADQVIYGFDYQEEIIELLEEHITDNIVKIGSDLYRQVVGIPQGSILSTLLCAIFYGNLEQTELKFTQDHENVLLRFVDDYLFITTSVKVARHFLQVMHKGHPEYGCEVAEEKTVTNFLDPDVQTLVLAPENECMHQVILKSCPANVTQISRGAEGSYI